MTAASAFVTEFYHLATECGLDIEQMMQDAGIDRRVVGDPGARVSNESLARLVVDVLDGLQDEAMDQSENGIPRGAFHMMGKVAVGELNLRRALLQSAKFYAMVTDAYRVTLEESGELAILRFNMKSSQYSRYKLFAEITLMAWHRMACWLIGENVVLHDVFFDYPAPAYVAEYSYLYPGRHVFEVDFLGFSFGRAFLEREVRQSRQALQLFISHCPEELFTQPKGDFSVSSDLKRLLGKSLLEGFPRIDEAADRLHMTKRTLIRKLRAEGTSYQELKDLVRRDRAIFLLNERSLTVSAVAEAVGFSDPATFARSFRSWTGVSPREYRVAAK